MRPFSGRLASARGHTRLRGVSPDGRPRCGPHLRALRAVVLGESVRWTRGKHTFKLPIRIRQMTHHACLDRIAPQVWTRPWNVHSQANPNSHTSFKSPAPYVFKVAISTSRIVSLTDRTVTFTDRKPGSTRQRTTHLDVIELGDEHETCKIPDDPDANHSVSHVRRVKANLRPALIRNAPAQRSIH